MKNIYHSLLVEIESGRTVCLSTLVGTRGSVPQVLGATALFSETGLLTGTLGGGVLEGHATKKAVESIKTKTSAVHEFDLNADYDADVGAICGGSASFLIDPQPEQSRKVFEAMINSLENESPGILATLLSPGKNNSPERIWLENGKTDKIPEESTKLLQEWNDFNGVMNQCLEKNTSAHLEDQGKKSLFLEPVRPLPGLYIVGAGHIGRALAHQANLLDFEVTIIDDRIEYANLENIPDADHIVVNNIGEAVEEIPKKNDCYIVIVSRGHRDDADALRACIDSDIPYLGMIGSKRKIRLMRENFIANGWCTSEQFERVHAPIGLEISSKTVQEIAISISAQLVQSRNQHGTADTKQEVHAIVLAAGESSTLR